MKKILTLTLLSFGIISSVNAADDTFTLSTEVIKNESLDKLHQQGLNTFEMFDIDNNDKISPSELEKSTLGLEKVPFYSSDDVEKVKQEISKAFDRFDTDKDGYLSRTEAEEFLSFLENMLVNLQIAKMDPNDDGTITEEEMAAFSKMLPSFQESMAKLQEATEKLKNINKNPDQHFNSMLSNINNNVNQEEYTQMDTNKDDKVTQKEFVDYEFNHPNNKELGFSEEDYQNIYYLIDTAHKGYISRQEYIDYNQKKFDEIMSH